MSQANEKPTLVDLVIIKVATALIIGLILPVIVWIRFQRQLLRTHGWKAVFFGTPPEDDKKDLP